MIRTCDFCGKYCDEIHKTQLPCIILEPGGDEATVPDIFLLCNDCSVELAHHIENFQNNKILQHG